MRKPVIGITSSYSEQGQIKMRPNYVRCIMDHGGIGVLLPQMTNPDRIREIAEDMDGFLFSGGGDVEPARYGDAEVDPTVKTAPERDAFEFALLAEVLKLGKPVLGICRGVQVMNVGIGGTLYQHIENHRQTPVPGSVTEQAVSVAKDTELFRITGAEQLLVNTFHHQAVREVGHGVIVSARAEDGTIEAIEMPGHRFFVGVQWHPELFYHLQKPMQSLFAAFVEASKA
ncbi:MAG: gamma-glutamyl-gamma-aminobutyrate hydrolase family protein [Clostridia bacterium]|nr:gamma-glutamyl-gamma-aminobutyrate hydrolase family protein [Clostridia bacterium]